MPYFYQHSEGGIIEKPALVVDSGGGPHAYFEGPFVRAWWFENDLLRPCRTEAPPQPADETGKYRPGETVLWAPPLIYLEERQDHDTHASHRQHRP